jgi:hypothetical protein
VSGCDVFRERFFAPGRECQDARELHEHLQHCPSCRLASQGLPLVDRALAQAAHLPVVTPPFETVELAAVRAARTQRHRANIRHVLPFLYTGLAAAVVTAGLVVMTWAGRGGVDQPRRLAPGARLHATAGAETAVLGSGTRIRLDAGAVKLAMASKGEERLYLETGRASLDVPRLAPGSALSVRTPEAEVRVHGTRFQVTRTGQETQIQVTEGVVEVRPEGIGRSPQFVHAGHSLTVESAEAYRESLRRAVRNAIDHNESNTAEKQVAKLLGSGADKAEQAEAHALLAWSLAVRGKRSEAIVRYRHALALLSDGQRPLWAENACAELAILLEQESPEHAAGAWAECLRRFPGGVHAAAARSRAKLNKAR